MDKIFLHGMKADTLIGVYEWERQHPQTLIFDLVIGVENRFTSSDNIGDTVHYGVVCDTVRAHLRTQSFLLLESLAEDTAQLLFQKFKDIHWLRVRIVKAGILPDVREVGVEIERTRP